MDKDKLYGQENISKLFKAVIDAGGDPVKDDYVLVVGKDAAIWLNVLVPIEIIKDADCPNDSVYLVQRKHYYGEEDK